MNKIPMTIPSGITELELEGPDDIEVVISGQADNPCMKIEFKQISKPTLDVKVVVNNYTSSQVDVTKSSNEDIEITIRRAIEKHAPGVIASQIQSPSSSLSKALGVTYDSNRRRI